MGNSDSHASFVDGIKRLLVEDVSDDDREFWTALFTAPMSVEDVFEIISPDHVRQLRQNRPVNLQVFLRRIVATMAEISEAAETCVLPAHLMTAANTTIRLLTRIVPFLLESGPETEDLSGNASDAIVYDILWKQGGYRPEAPPEEVPLDNEARTTGAGEGSGVAPSLPSTVCAEDILWQVARFLFLPSYTCIPRERPQDNDRGQVPTHTVDARVVWKGGVGITKDLSFMPAKAMSGARAEVLRCLLACLSGPLFQSADEFQSRPPKWLLRFTGGEVCHTANVFCSLMSTVFDYDPVGWGLPYGGYFRSGSEEDLVDVALQLLCVVMDFDPKEEEQNQSAGLVIAKKGDTPKNKERKRPRNVYRHMLQNISKEEEIDLIFSGLVRLLSTVHQANQTYLPNSFRSVGFFQEALILLWHLLMMNQAFMRRVADHLDTNQIVLPVLYLLQQAQNSVQLLGLLHTASFVLLVLSSERSCAVRLNETYVSKIPLTIPTFKGNHADVLMLTLHKAVSESLARPQNDALVEIMLTVLCNVSPYIKCFALESCLKLLSLIERCSRPAYIFRSAFTHHGLLMLVEMVNNILQYQYEGNTMLVYSVLRQKEVFQDLTVLELPKAKAALTGNVSQLGQTSCSEEHSVEQPAAAKALAADGDTREEQEVLADDTEDKEPASTAWFPTPEWLAGVKKKLPLEVIQCMVNFLAPHVEALCRKNDITDQDEVLRYLKQTTMVGILPVPHPIVIRTYQGSAYTAMWFTSYMWGVIFTRSQRMPTYDWRKIRLVEIKQ